MRNRILCGTPYATIADDGGRFEFVDVVPGPYALIGFSGEHAVDRRVEIAGDRVEVKLP